MTDQEKKSRIKVLDVITKQYETVISNYSLDETEDLNDEEYDVEVQASNERSNFSPSEE